MAFTYLKVKSAKCLCLLPVVLVLVLRIWSCLHHCNHQCQSTEGFFWYMLLIIIITLLVVLLINNGTSSSSKISVVPYGHNFRGIG